MAKSNEIEIEIILIVTQQMRDDHARRRSQKAAVIPELEELEAGEIFLGEISAEEDEEDEEG